MRGWKSIVDDIVGPRLLVNEAGRSLPAVSLMMKWLDDGTPVPWVRSLLWWRCACTRLSAARGLFITEYNALRNSTGYDARKREPLQISL